MIGKPKYKRGDIVKFKVNDTEKIGVIKIVDEYGTYFNNNDVSYDILVQDENCLYKHFQENTITERIKQSEEIMNKYAVARKDFELVVVNAINTRQATIKISKSQKWKYSLKFNLYEMTCPDIPNVTISLLPEDFISMFKIVEEK